MRKNTRKENETSQDLFNELIICFVQFLFWQMGNFSLNFIFI